MLKAKIAVGLLLMVMAAVVVSAADTAAPAAPAGGGGRFAGAGGPGGGDPAAFRAQAMQRVKDSLGATDDEWKIIEPKLTKVTDLSRELAPARGRGMRGGPGGGAAPAAPTTPPTDVEKARTALQTAVDDAASTPATIKEKLAALRTAKEKVRTQLDKATADLKSVLSAKQEALLVLSNTIE